MDAARMAGRPLHRAAAVAFARSDGDTRFRRRLRPTYRSPLVKLLDLLFIAQRVDQPRFGGLPFIGRTAAAHAVRETGPRLLDHVRTL
jgi:hypothetical protein